MLRTFERLIEPRADLVDVADRQRARMLAAFLLVGTCIGLIVAVLQLLTIPGFGPSFVLMVTVIAILQGLVAVIRTRHYRVGAAVALVVIIVGTAIAGVLLAGAPEWWAYTLIPVLLATLFLSIREATMIAILAVLVIAGVGYHHEGTLAALIPSLSFVAVFMPLMLLVAHTHNRLEATRRRELRFHADMLERAQRLAGLGHWVTLRGSQSALASPALMAMLGLETEHVALSEILDRFDTDRRDQLATLVQGAAGEARALEIEYRRARDRGTAQVCAKALGVEGDRDLIVTTVHDLTQRVKHERQTLELMAQLHDAQRLEVLGRVAGGIAHDFNNIVTVIAANAELLVECDDPELESELASEIKLAAQRAMTLIEQLLEYARRRPGPPERLELTEVVAEMLPILNRLALPAHLECRFETDLAPVVASRVEIEQLLLNLVSNAVDAVDPDGHIDIAIRASSDGGDLLLAVCDDGAGMSEEVRAHMFEPFFSTKGERTGLGLSTVERIVDKVGGSIEVKSKPGEGTCFRIHLEPAPDDVATRVPA